MSKKFSRESGWDENILFEYAKRHLIAAQILFQNQDINIYVLSVSSAGYLCHLGIELLLKACCLHELDYFEDEHNLIKLEKKVGFLRLDDRLSIFLSNLQLFNEMRYPQDLTKVKVVQDMDINANLAEEIGDHDWVGTIELLYEVQKQMPEKLYSIAKPVFANFESVFTERKYLKNGKYLYRLVLDV